VLYTTPGTYSFSVPITSYYQVECVGGGGGGGNQNEGWVAGGGGAGSSYIRGIVTLHSGHEVSITVGRGGSGAGPRTWADGEKGGDSYLTVQGMEWIKAEGGGGGYGDSSTSGGTIGSGIWTPDNVEGIHFNWGGWGAPAYIIPGSYHNGGAGGGAGNSGGWGSSGVSGPVPTGGLAAAGVLTVGPGGRGYMGPASEQNCTAGGPGAGGGGGHDLGACSGGHGVVRITKVR
jgi:hypothetical protein